MDKISIIIRNKNEERYIGYAIQSVLHVFKDPEIIVVDNNSTDDSLEIVKSFNFSNLSYSLEVLNQLSNSCSQSLHFNKYLIILNI